MSVTGDIFRAWRHPRAVLRRQLAIGPREDRALVYLMAACLIIFVGQWPRLAREAYLDPSAPLDARLAGALLGWLFIAPLALYALAGLSHLAARAAGGRGSWFGARLALFWSLLASVPLWLAHGLASAFLAAGPARLLVASIAFFGFLFIWLSSLVEAETGGAEP